MGCTHVLTHTYTYLYTNTRAPPHTPSFTRSLHKFWSIGDTAGGTVSPSNSQGGD